MMESNFVNEEVNHGLKLLAKSSMIVFVGLFFSKVFTYVYRIVIARHFGPEIYGVFTLAVMILGWFVAVSVFGLTDGILRFISLYRGKKEINKIQNIFRFCLIFLFFSTIFAAALMYLLAEFLAVSIFHAPDLIFFFKSSGIDNVMFGIFLTSTNYCEYCVSCAYI